MCKKWVNNMNILTEVTYKEIKEIVKRQWIGCT